ncbi:NOL1/NOP2/sun family putative RNA methylase [Weissella beninensis]|uniref:RsmF rRNA methyltransferase first C-terminal domain-containing protein n=1 Tax=Periweissella beninensis TaxID=504936 RepID=A0ABT0VIP7_9LACO|nr:RsmB/NOP family class I SAM-dependent RNA methyltransferase [Periweissella beninensis]MBM7544117.1 NOL1/NOP2/sun family putative RNA methylase [Periweissella beninensis]MCM2437510.1 RsmF rRNA methyltransferase first C-terminal domain-containing protein [Periweissella beninensis]
MDLPKDFVSKYQKLLGTQAAAFFAAFDEPIKKGYRINPLKINQQLADTDRTASIDYVPFGYYGKVKGHSIDHTTGLVYSQEPSAMLVGEVARPKPGEKVLDLSAAPGGKTTHLASYLGNSGLLVSNEIFKKRAVILAENVERFGLRNVVVTNESPQKLAPLFPNFFDRIVVDAPCSGEGMFRKDPDAMQYWHQDYPKECARLQREILAAAVKMLAPEAELIYSTCTFAPEENEQIIAWLLKTYPALELLPIDKPANVDDGQPAWADNNPELSKTARLFPHHFAGEGHFIAKLKWHKPVMQTTPKLVTSNLTCEQQKLWQIFATDNILTDLPGVLVTFGDQLYCVPKMMIDLKRLTIMRAGVHMGTFKKNRFEPSFALGLALTPLETKKQIEITEEQWRQYVHGETLTLTSAPVTGNGWYQVVVNGNGFGFAKVVGQTLKNFYPKGLRFLVK